MTREEFRKAVADTVVNWNEKASANDCDPELIVTMGMQNMLFGAMLETELFDKETEKNIKEDK